MPVTNGSNFIWSFYDSQSNRDMLFVDYFYLPALASETWTSADYTEGQSYRVGFSSGDGSRIGARTDVWNSGRREIVTLNYADGSVLNSNNKYEFSVGAKTGTSYTDTSFSRESNIWKYIGDKTTTNDDVTASHDWSKSIVTTGSRATSSSQTGTSRQTMSEVESLTFSSKQYFLSSQNTAFTVLDQTTFLFNTQDSEDNSVFRQSTYNFNNYRFIDRADNYDFSAGKASFVVTKNSSGFGATLELNSLRITTDDYVLTAAKTGPQLLTPVELQIADGVFLTPESGSMAQVRAFTETVFKPVALRGDNTFTLKSTDGYEFDAGGGNDRVNGNAGEDVLRGGDGNDGLTGGGGDDLLFGDGGNDTLTGGLGTDTMSGGEGKDIFRFNSLADLGISEVRDVITDFVRGQDKISFAGIDANPTTSKLDKFVFQNPTATAPSSWVGRVTYTRNGNDFIVQVSTDEDMAGEYQIQVTIPTAVTSTQLTASDFLF